MEIGCPKTALVPFTGGFVQRADNSRGECHHVDYQCNVFDIAWFPIEALSIFVIVC